MICQELFRGLAWTIPAANPAMSGAENEVPLDVVIDFKREVYELALSELARYISRGPRMMMMPWGSPLDLYKSTLHDPKQDSEPS